MSKLREGAFVFDTCFDNGRLTTIDDNGVLEGPLQLTKTGGINSVFKGTQNGAQIVNWIPEIENSEDSDNISETFIDSSETFIDYCYSGSV